MQELFAQILLIIKGAWRYRWYGVAAAWIVAVAGWLLIQLIPDRYDSSTTVYVDTESLLKPLLEGLAVDRNVMTQVSMMQAVMLSRPNLERVARQTDLFLGAADPDQQAAVVDSLQQKVTLARTVSTRRNSEANTFTVTYTDENPKRAQRVVQTLLDTFMEDSLGLKESDSGTAARFLEAQRQDYEVKLNEAESRLAEFKRDNLGLMPGEGGDYYQRLQQEIVTLEALRGRALQISQRRIELERQVAGEDPTFGLVASTAASAYDAQIASSRARIDQLLVKYTDKHPEVVALREEISKLEEQKAQPSSGAPLPAGTATTQEAIARSLDMNPVYQNLKIALSTTEAELAELRGQIANQETVVGRLRGRIDAIPAVEAELTRLNRDYEVNRNQYNELLQRIESARISSDAERSTDDVKFRVINPPVVATEPSDPDRRALSTGVLLLSLLAGLGVAALLSQLRPAFLSRTTLRNLTGLPVIGSVSAMASRIRTPWYRKQPVMVGAALGLLLVAWVLSLVLSDTLRSAAKTVIG